MFSFKGMIIGLIVKYAGGGPTAQGLSVKLNSNLTRAPQTLWVTIGNFSKFSYQLKGVLRTVTTKAGSELEDMVSFLLNLFLFPFQILFCKHKFLIKSAKL